jgi:hypothetical protein
VQRQQGGRDEHDVAHAEDVAHRPRGRNGEDVAEEGQVRMGDRPRVGELAGLLMDPRGCERIGIGWHDAAVGRDGDEVQRPAQRGQPQVGDVAVGPQEGGDQAVGGEVDRVMQPAGALRQQRDDHDLPGDGHERQPRGAEAHVGERGKPPARERDGGQAQREADADQHALWIDPAVAGLNAPPSGRRMCVDG